MFVNRFDVKGGSNRPGQGIVLDELHNLLEDLRIDRQSLNKVDETGFTAPEKSQIAAFMARVVADPDLEMNFEEYEALVDKLREEKSMRDSGMTIGQMQQIATAVTEYYRSAGFILAQAFIPAQEVVDGIVTIEVLEGTLGNVLAEGNKKFSDAVLAKPFEQLIDSPVTAESIESAILTVSDYPGLSVFGVFQPGREVGETDLTLRVQDEKPFAATARFDNHGTRFTGERRAFADFTWNNPLGQGDHLTATLLKQYRPKNSVFGSIEYEVPIGPPGMSIGGSYQHNPFRVGAELDQANLSGESKIGKIFVRRTLKRSRQTNINGRLGWKRGNSITKQNLAEISKDNISAIEGEVTFDNIDTENRAINLGSVGFTMGLGDGLGGDDDGTASARNANAAEVDPGRVGGSGKVASNDFAKFNASYSRLQLLGENQSLLVRLEGQYSNNLLTSLEQYSIGGPSSVRAFNISEKLFDSAFFSSAEWTVNAPGFADVEAFKGLTWGEVLRVSFFSDFAWGYKNDPATGEEANSGLSGYGGAVTFNVPGQFIGRVQLARPLGKKVPSGDDKGSKWWFDFTYLF